MDQLFLLRYITESIPFCLIKGIARVTSCSPTIFLSIRSLHNIQTYCHGSHFQKQNKMPQISSLTFPSSCQISLQHLNPSLYNKTPQMHSLYLLSHFFLHILSNPISFHSTTIPKPLLARLPILSNCPYPMAISKFSPNSTY